jgi:hypothetical protein
LKYCITDHSFVFPWQPKTVWKYVFTRLNPSNKPVPIYFVLSFSTLQQNPIDFLLFQKNIVWAKQLKLATLIISFWFYLFFPLWYYFSKLFKSFCCRNYVLIWVEFQILNDYVLLCAWYDLLHFFGNKVYYSFSYLLKVRYFLNNFWLTFSQRIFDKFPHLKSVPELNKQKGFFQPVICEYGFNNWMNCYWVCPILLGKYF